MSAKQMTQVSAKVRALTGSESMPSRGRKVGNPRENTAFENSFVLMFPCFNFTKMVFLLHGKLLSCLFLVLISVFLKI